MVAGFSGQWRLDWDTECVARVCLRISCCSQKNFRNVPQSDPMAPAQLICCAVIGSSGAQLSENCPCNSLLLCARRQLSYNCHLLFPRRGGTHWLAERCTAWASLCKNNFPAQWGTVGARRPRLSCRWDMLHLGQLPRSQPCYWSVENYTLVTMCLRAYVLRPLQEETLFHTT